MRGLISTMKTNQIFDVIVIFFKNFCYGFTIWALVEWLKSDSVVDLNICIAWGMMGGLYGTALRIRDQRLNQIPINPE